MLNLRHNENWYVCRSYDILRPMNVWIPTDNY